MIVKYKTWLPFIARKDLLEPDGRYQYVVRFRDMVVCICYQPPLVTHFHSNKNGGSASDAVFVIEGDYTSELLDNYSQHGIDSFDVSSAIVLDTVNINSKEFKILKHRKGLLNKDTAGPNGAFMLHFNPVDETKDYVYDLVDVNTTKNFRPEVITEGISITGNPTINNTKLGLLSRFTLHGGIDYEIRTSSDDRVLLYYDIAHHKDSKHSQ